MHLVHIQEQLRRRSKRSLLEAVEEPVSDLCKGHKGKEKKLMAEDKETKVGMQVQTVVGKHVREDCPTWSCAERSKSEG